MLELLVVPDIAEEAAALFQSAAPRTVVLAGGATPALTYARLATLDYGWRDTAFFFGDERCVPADDPASNYQMAWTTLLSKIPAAVHRMPGERCDADAYELELNAVMGAGLPRFDLIFLGLGTDGHTASLFPDDEALRERERHVVRVTRADHARLTLTLPVLSAAKLAIFLVSGDSKREALEWLVRGEAIPATSVRAERVVVIADQSAAGNLVPGTFL